MHTRSLPLVLLASALLVSEASAACPEGRTNPNTPVDMAALDAKLKRGEVDSITFADLVLRGTDPDRVDFEPAVTLGKRRYLIPWTQCRDRYTCSGHIAIIEVPRQGRPRHRARSLLPFWFDGVDEDGVTIQRLGLMDVNLDGDKELLVEYKVREDVVGNDDPDARYRVLLGIWSLRKLRLQWVYEKDRHGDDDPRDWNCSGTLMRRDVNCDRRTDIVMERECYIHACREDTGDHIVCQRKEPKAAFKYLPDKGYYLGLSEVDTIGVFDDGLDYVVVAGNVQVASGDYEERAARLVERLHDAGFADAVVFNSRSFRRMNCCFRTIVVGRYKDKDAAQERVKELKAKGFRAYVHRAN